MSAGRLEQVEQACADLAAHGEDVTFVTVAERSGVPRVTLYRNPELRAVVEEHRLRSREAQTLSGLHSEIVNLRLALEAVATRVRRHDETLRNLTKPVRSPKR
jgi:hypothetical protein